MSSHAHVEWVGRGHRREPLVDYAVVIGTFLTCGAVAVTSAVRHGRAPQSVRAVDLVLLGLATARLARLVAREKVTRAVRAPFTDVAPGAKPDEVREEPRPETRAMGELVLCSRCVGVWAGAAFVLAFAWAPAATRLVGMALTASLISDVVNLEVSRLGHATHDARSPT
jgi:hypothetical protein